MAMIYKLTTLGNLRSKYSEWHVASALCSESYESVSSHFGSLFKAVDKINVRHARYV